MRKRYLWQLGLMAIVLTCCAALKIKTWLINTDEEGIIRKNDKGEIIERKKFLEVNGFRCYSPEDDLIWRTRLNELNACCNQCTH